MRIGLAVGLVVYAAASLIHHIHNAEYLAEYPNMPVWLTPAKVYVVWTVETALGVLGYILFRGGYRAAGLAMIALYAVFGFAGLDHYYVAPFAAHTFTMHLTILLEVAAATLLLVTTLLSLKRRNV